MQAVEMQGRFSTNDEAYFAQSKRLILHGQQKPSVEKYLDDILADDRVAIHSQRMPINRLGDNGGLAQPRPLVDEPTAHLQLLGCQIDNRGIKMLFVLEADDNPPLPHAALLGITQSDGHVTVFVLEFIRDQQLIAGPCLAGRLRLEDIGGGRGFFLWCDGPDGTGVSSDHELGKARKGVLWSLLIEGPAVKQLTQRLLLEVLLFLRGGFQLDRGYGHRR